MIQLNGLTAGYSGKPVVRDISLDFLPGEVLVLLGPNGSGKSTLLKAALGLLPLMGGQVLYDGVDIRRMNRRQVAQKAAFLTQSRNTPSILALRMVLHGRFPYLSYPRRYGERFGRYVDDRLGQCRRLSGAVQHGYEPDAQRHYG